MTPVLLDTIVGIIILLSVVFAFFRGFIKEMLTVVSLAAASYAAYFMGPQLEPGFAKWLATPEREGDEINKIFGVIPPDIMATFSAYATVFFAVFIVVTMAGFYISHTARALGLGPIDKLLGVAFGAVRGFLLVFLMYVPFGMSMEFKNYPDWAKNSVTVAKLDETFQWSKKKFDDRDKDNIGEIIDPNSIAGKLQKMSDEQQFQDITEQDIPELPLGTPTEDAGHVISNGVREILPPEEMKEPTQ